MMSYTCLPIEMERLRSNPSKPQSEQYRPELTRLPPLTFLRRLVRRVFRLLARLLLAFFTDLEVHGLSNLPGRGPALIVANHLGDADFVVGVAYSQGIVEPFAKSELYDFPILGRLLEAYGVIWIHRGRPDRRALRAALQAFEEERIVGITPEARESLSGSLEEGTGGAAYLALKGDVPVIPVTFTGTENKRVYGNMKRMRRTRLSLTIGPAFRLIQQPTLREGITEGTETIMRVLARQLPPEYRGIYHT
jgi:1-acyl-sn-glycerol-3-phosphate acyltransferase